MVFRHSPFHLLELGGLLGSSASPSRVAAWEGSQGKWPGAATWLTLSVPHPSETTVLGFLTPAVLKTVVSYIWSVFVDDVSVAIAGWKVDPVPCYSMLARSKVLATVMTGDKTGMTVHVTDQDPEALGGGPSSLWTPAPGSNSRAPSAGAGPSGQLSWQASCPAGASQPN